MAARLELGRIGEPTPLWNSNRTNPTLNKVLQYLEEQKQVENYAGYSGHRQVERPANGNVFAY